MFSRTTFLALAVAAVSADGSHNHRVDAYSYDAPEPVYKKHEPAPFSFDWSVDEPYSGNKYSHQSESDGKVIKGEYSVLLPDGRTKIVKYTADHYSGFVAKVTYEEPKHGKHGYEAPKRTYEAPKQSYKAPKRTYKAPEQTYKAPEPAYKPPKQTYSAPERKYEAPRQTYEAPRQTYEAPRQTYEAPQQTYEAPQQTYEAPEPTYESHEESYFG